MGCQALRVKDGLFKESEPGEVSSACQGHAEQVLQPPSRWSLSYTNTINFLLLEPGRYFHAQLYEMETNAILQLQMRNLSKKQVDQQHDIKYLMGKDEIRKHKGSQAFWGTNGVPATQEAGVQGSLKLRN